MRQSSLEWLVIGLAFLLGFAASVMIEKWECEQQAAEWLEEGR